MRVRIHILDTDDKKISEWEISEHVANFSLQDVIVVGGKRFEIVRIRPSLIGDPWGPYDRVLIVFPFDSGDS